ncbi:MAG: acetyltransferase [Bacteroidetes bacterium]|nr:acetyltransferase [Bacteroidota bacterium]
MNDIAIFGAGGFGREVKMLIDQINQSNQRWRFFGYFDDGIQKGTLINGYPVKGTAQDLLKLDRELYVVFAIGNPKVKKSVVEIVKANQYLKFPTLVHPTVLMDSDFVQLIEGCIITANNVITTNINIGKHVIVNLSCTIGHDTSIGDYSSIMPGVNISGEVAMQEGVYVGTGAKIINQLTLGEWSVVGAGAVVSKDVAPHTTVVGVPAKPLIQ